MDMCLALMRINNNSKDNVYSAVIITRDVVRVYSVHMRTVKTWQPAFGISQLALAISPPVDSM